MNAAPVASSLVSITRASIPSRRHAASASARRSDRLVRALAAWAHLEARADDRLAKARHAAGAKGEIGDENAENDDAAFLAHRACLGSGQKLTSGETTPFLKRKQP